MGASIRECYDNRVNVGEFFKQDFASFLVVFFGPNVLAWFIDGREQTKQIANDVNFLMAKFNGVGQK